LANQAPLGVPRRGTFSGEHLRYPRNFVTWLASNKKEFIPYLQVYYDGLTELIHSNIVHVQNTCVGRD